MYHFFPIPASAFGDIYAKVVGYLQELRLSDPYIFWGSVAAAAALLILIIVLAVVRHKKKSRAKDSNAAVGLSSAEKTEEEQVVFVPMEDSNDEIEAEYKPLPDKLTDAEGNLSRKLTEQLRNRGPKGLADILAAYDNCRPEIQEQLAALVKSERLMERYSRRLDRPEYPQGVLVDAWQHFANRDTLKDFMEMLASPDEETQMMGASLLSTLKDPQSLPLLTAALMWPDHFVPARVAEVFAAIGAPGARLLAYMLPKVEDKHKVRVLETIGKIGTSYPYENVADCLGSDDPQIRTAAAMALGASRMPDAAPVLMLAASDRDWQVRAAVAKALGLVGDQRAVSVLDMLTQDNEGWVAEAAKASLELFATA